MDNDVWLDSLLRESKHRTEAQREMASRMELELEDDAKGRNLSYEPPFSGSRPQMKIEYDQIHPRWIEKLKSDLPEDVPLEPDRQWPNTFYRNDLSQCGSCTYYVTLEGDLGGDWGACTNPRSQYDRTCVFEHWTCKEFRR